jgi:CRP-like cAMP-binding protein
VPARLAATLLRFAEDDVVRSSHQELADAIGAYRETVTKTLDEFQREGLVELGRMRIGLKDRDRLSALAGQSEAMGQPAWGPS